MTNNIEKYNEEKHGKIELWAGMFFRATIGLFAFAGFLTLLWLFIAGITRFDFNLGLIIATAFFGVLIIALIIAALIILKKGILFKKVMANKEKLLVTEALITKVAHKKSYVLKSAGDPNFNPTSHFDWDKAMGLKTTKKSIRTTYEFVDNKDNKSVRSVYTGFEMGKAGETLQVFFLGKYSYPFLKLQEEVRPRKRGKKAVLPQIRIGATAVRDNDELEAVLSEYYTRRNWNEKELEAMLSAASSGNGRAQVACGGMFIFGDGVRQSDDKAVEWLTKACEQNILSGWQMFRLFQNYSYSDKVQRAYRVLSRRRNEIEEASFGRK